MRVSVPVAHRLSCSVACGIFPDQGLNPQTLFWQVDSQPLHHQGSPNSRFLLVICFIHISEYMSMTISQFIPPPPPPSAPSFSPLVPIRLFSTSVSLFLPYKSVHLYHFSRFHIYALVYICFSDLLHSV